MSKVIIDGVPHIPEMQDGEHCIIVLDRGFVLYGRVRHQDQYVIINDCQCIRRWGTQQGLGQLAIKGPQPNTTLDPQPQTRVHELQVVQIIRCEGNPWKR